MKTDIWSLGCLMFYIFTEGVEPWSAQLETDDVKKQIKKKANFFADVKGKQE